MCVAERFSKQIITFVFSFGEKENICFCSGDENNRIQKNKTFFYFRLTSHDLHQSKVNQYDYASSFTI